MDMQKVLTVLGAVLLTVLFYLVGYVIWYIAYGRRLRERRRAAGGGAEAAPARRQNGRSRWGVDRDAYCYPTINDEMDFELIHVVQIRRDDEEEESEEGETRTGWAGSKGTGTSEMTVRNARQESEDRLGDEMQDETPEKGGAAEEKEAQDEGGEGDGVDIEATEEDMNYLMNSRSEWKNRDYDIPDDDDKDIAQIIDNHYQDIEDGREEDADRYKVYDSMRSHREWMESIAAAQKSTSEKSDLITDLMEETGPLEELPVEEE